MTQLRPPRAQHADHAPVAPRGRLFWSCLVIGAAVIGYGLTVAWADRADTHPAELAVWLAGAGIVHDFALAPLIVLVAWLSNRLPDAPKLPVRLGVALSALVTVLFWPLVRGWGRSPSVPSALPLDYGRNLAMVLAITWAGVAVAVAVRARRQRR